MTCSMFVPAQARAQAYDMGSKALSALNQGHHDMMAPDQADTGPLRPASSLSWRGENSSVEKTPLYLQRLPPAEESLVCRTPRS